MAQNKAFNDLLQQVKIDYPHGSHTPHEFMNFLPELIVEVGDMLAGRYSYERNKERTIGKALRILSLIAVEAEGIAEFMNDNMCTGAKTVYEAAALSKEIKRISL